MFPGGMGMNGMQGMLKKVQKMQTEMAKMQEAMKTRTFEASVGGGAVTVTMTGAKVCKGVKINPSAVDPEDVEMLEDLVLSAFNEVLKTIDDTTEKEMAKITGGMKMPGMF